MGRVAAHRATANTRKRKGTDSADWDLGRLCIVYVAQKQTDGLCLAISRTLNSRDARGPVVKRLIAQRMSVPYGSAVAPYGSAAHGGGVGDCENELSLAGAKDEAAHFDTALL